MSHRNNIPDGLSTKKDKISDKLITPQTLLSSSTTTSLWTSALTMVSITENKESNFLQVCTPSNHSFRCSFACLRVTSRLLYVFSAARFCKQKREKCKQTAGDILYEIQNLQSHQILHRYLEVFLHHLRLEVLTPFFRQIYSMLL